MKKLNKLFAILIAVLGVTTLKAQNWTDKTSLLANPSFENETTATNLGSGKNGWGGPTGWILSPSTAPANSQSGAIASSCNIQGIATTFPTADGGNYFYVRTNWNNDVTFSLSQVVNDAPAGLYRLTCKVANNSGNWKTSKFNLTLKEGDNNAATNSSLKSKTWTDWSVCLYKKDSSTPLTIEATMYPGSSGNGQHYQLLLDDFKLEYQSFDDINTNGWLAPVVPGSDITGLIGTETNVGMYNVGADAFTSRGMTWGTQAIATKLHNSDTKDSERHRVQISAGNGSTVKFKVSDKQWLGDGGQGTTTTVYTDQGSKNIEFKYSIVDEGNVYSLKVATATNDVDAYLDVAQPYGGQLTYANGQGFTEWAFIKISDIENGKYAQYKAKKAMYEVYKAVVDAGHSSTYSDALRTALETYIRTDVAAADVTAATKALVAAVSPALTAGYVNAGALFTNPDMRGAGTKADWTSGYTNLGWGVFENFHTNHGDRKLTQTKTVPNGFYKVVFHGIWRQDGSNASPTLTLRSGDNSVSANVPCMTDVAFGVGNTNGSNNWKDANGKIIPDGMQSAGEALSHGNAQVTISDFVVSDGELTIEMNSSSTSQWILAQGFDIYFKAESMEEYANLFYAAKSAAEAIDQNTLNTYAKNTLTTALNNAATVQLEKTWYQEHTAALNNAVTIANDIATAYPKTSALLNICDGILSNSEEFEDGAKATFSEVVSASQTNVATAQTSAVINEIYNTLEAARKTYVVKADPTNGTYFDYTFNIVNPSFETGGTDGWTTSTGGDTGAKLNSNGTYTINGADGEFVFNTWGTSDMRVEQTLQGIPTGLYTAKAIVASDANNVITLTAGGTTLDVTITTDKSTATEGVVETSYSSGDFLIKAASASWFKADHFRLYYYGFDVATAQQGVTESKAKAEGLVGKPMNAGVASALQVAIDGADATKTTRNELSPMIDALNKAIEDAKASIAAYEKLAGYISMTKVFTDVTEYEEGYNNGEYATDEVETVRQELNVVRYDAASALFTNKVDVTGWTGTMGERDNEHWSGTTVSYKDANSWSDVEPDALTTQITLPKGNYVLKVAGRCSEENATLTLKVLDQTITFHGKGATGKGIDTSGAANFSDGTYANSNNGFGWEWEFLKFSLDAEQTVTLEVNSSYNNTMYVWNSFGDITLWMDDETYLTVNGHAVNAPLADAKALVDTKPMGTAENDALKAAIVLGENVSTAQGLDEAIVALNEAVANANAWVAAYNEAKAPLVAALERFEADYNKDGVKMSKTAWNNVLDKVKAAALAKDVTDSYDGFAAAEKDLTDALVEADKSIEAYKEFKSAIEEAEGFVDANLGEGVFQISQKTADGLGIDAAKKAYTDAALDGDEVESAIKALNDAVANVELNAPAADARYTFTFNCEGHSANGNAITLIENGRDDQGYYGIKYLTKVNANYAQAFTLTKATGRSRNCYYFSQANPAGEAIYLTTATLGYGVSNYHSGLRITTDATKALEVQIIPTDGGYTLYNTKANAAIAHNGLNNNAAFTNDNATFSIAEAAKVNVTLNISDARWATLILPFNAELPEGVKAYSCGGADGETLTLTEATSIKANTPYLVSGAKGTYNFSGYGLADKDSYKDDLFTGTYVDYKTEADKNIYVLQKNNDVLGFYLVGENAQPTVKAYRCYMTYDNAAGAPMFRIGEDETTSIHNSEFSTQDSAVVYDLMGRRVTTMEKGGMYIVNGKKVIVK